jgi:predicted DNA-binding transcriptional regulator YafY
MTPEQRWPALLLHLSASDWMRASDLAEALGVSERTVYRDTQALMEAGVPVQGVPGKGYRLPDDYHLDPLRLTVDEAVMLVLGSGYAAQNFDGRYRASARSAQQKLESRLPETEREKALSLQGNVSLVPPSVFGGAPEDPLLHQLRKALLEERAIHLQTHGEPERLYPYGLVRTDGTWHLVAFAPERDRVVHRRLSQGADIALTDTTFERPSGYRSSSGSPAAPPPSRTVRVVFNAEAAAVLQIPPALHVADAEALADGRQLLTLRVHHERELLPWLLSWGAHVQVVAPPALRQHIREEARRVADQYADEPSLLG